MFGDGLNVREPAAQSCLEPTRMADKKCATGNGPDGHIDLVIADVIESPLAEDRGQCACFSAAGEIGLLVASEHPGHAAYALSNQFDPATTGGGGEPYRTALFLSRMNGCKSFGTKRDGIATRIAPLGEAGLEVGLAAGQPSAEPPSVKRVPCNELQRSLMQQVSLDERAVDVNDQRNVAVLESLGRVHWRTCGAPDGGAITVRKVK